MSSTRANPRANTFGYGPTGEPETAGMKAFRFTLESASDRGQFRRELVAPLVSRFAFDLIGVGYLGGMDLAHKVLALGAPKFVLPAMLAARRDRGQISPMHELALLGEFKSKVRGLSPPEIDRRLDERIKRLRPVMAVVISPDLRPVPETTGEQAFAMALAAKRMRGDISRSAETFLWWLHHKGARHLGAGDAVLKASEVIHGLPDRILKDEPRRDRPTPRSYVKHARRGGFESKDVGFQVKAIDDGYFSGLGAVFHNLDSVGDIIAPGAFAHGLPEFLSSGFIAGMNHDWDNPIGHPVEARETAEGLFIRAVFDDTPDARNVRAKMTPHPLSGRATIRKLSIGYKPAASGGDKILAGVQEIRAYWAAKRYTPSPLDLQRAEARGSARLLLKLHLFEVSPVAVPANERALIATA